MVSERPKPGSGATAVRTKNFTARTAIRAAQAAQDASAQNVANEIRGTAGPRYRHRRQSSRFMLFRRNVSVCVQSLEGLYFYRVPSPPATSDGSMRPLTGNPGVPRGVSRDATPDADGELRTTGVGVMSGVADAEAGTPADDLQDDTEPISVVASEPAATAADDTDSHALSAATEVGAAGRAGADPIAGSDTGDEAAGPAEAANATAGPVQQDAAGPVQQDAAGPVPEDTVRGSGKSGTAAGPDRGQAADRGATSV